MPPTIPLLSLPHLAIEGVEQFYKVSEIINLSLCSRKIRKFLKIAERRRKTAIISVTIEPRRGLVNVMRENSDDGFTWILHAKRDSQIDEATGFTDQLIEGVVFKVKESHEQWVSITRESSFEDHFLIMLRMLSTLFGCHRFSTIKLKFGDDTDFDKLLMSTGILRNASFIEIRESGFSPAETTFMFDNFVTEDFRFNGHTDEGFIYRRPFRFPKIHISTGSWINLEILMQMSKTNRQIWLQSARLISDQDLNHFLRCWLFSDNQTLETLKISRRTPSWSMDDSDCEEMPAPFNIADILQNISHIPGAQKIPGIAKDFAVRSVCMEQNDGREYKYHEGVDIRRGDGLLATVLVCQEPDESDEFLFNVWYHFDPNVPID